MQVDLGSCRAVRERLATSHLCEIARRVHVIAIEERAIEALREQSAEGRFAGTGGAEEDGSMGRSENRRMFNLADGFGSWLEAFLADSSWDWLMALGRWLV
jgi:hypothetical protein